MKKDISYKIEKNLIAQLKQLPMFVSDYIYTLKTNRALRTQFEYSKDIRLFLEFLLHEGFIQCEKLVDIQPHDLNSISEVHIRYFLDYLSDYDKIYTTKLGKTITQNFSNSDIGKSRKLASLHKFFGYLFKNEYISKDVSANVDISVPTTRRIKDILSPEEIEKLFNTIMDDVNIENNRAYKFHQKVKFRDCCIVLVLAYTGIRISELVQIDIEDIKIDKQKMKVVRKGGNDDIIIIPQRILEDLDYYLSLRKQENLSTKALFISLQRKRIDPKTVRIMLEKYRTRAGIDVKLTPHVFRRTFGTAHYNKYEDMYLTAKVMGHTSGETTRKYYAQPSEERAFKSMNSFDFFKDENDDIITVDLNKLKEIEQLTGLNLKSLIKK